MTNHKDLLPVLIEKYKDKLYGLCLHLERNPHGAKDLFQDAWLKVIERIHMYDGNKSFWPWLAAITVNIYRDRFRRMKNRSLCINNR